MEFFAKLISLAVFSIHNFKCNLKGNGNAADKKKDIFQLYHLLCSLEESHTRCEMAWDWMTACSCLGAFKELGGCRKCFGANKTLNIIIGPQYNVTQNASKHLMHC